MIKLGQLTVLVGANIVKRLNIQARAVAVHGNAVPEGEQIKMV
jgi:hypothetical protein